MTKRSSSDTLSASAGSTTVDFFLGGSVLEVDGAVFDAVEDVFGFVDVEVFVAVEYVFDVETVDFF